MPKQSERQHLLLSFEKLLYELATHGRERNKAFKDIHYIYSLLRSSRFMYAKHTSMRQMLFHWHESVFRSSHDETFLC